MWCLAETVLRRKGCVCVQAGFVAATTEELTQECAATGFAILLHNNDACRSQAEACSADPDCAQELEGMAKLAKKHGVRVYVGYNKNVTK